MGFRSLNPWVSGNPHWVPMMWWCKWLLPPRWSILSKVRMVWNKSIVPCLCLALLCQYIQCHLFRLDSVCAYFVFWLNADLSLIYFFENFNCVPRHTSVPWDMSGVPWEIIQFGFFTLCWIEWKIKFQIFPRYGCFCNQNW